MNLKTSFLKGMVTGIGLSAEFLAGQNAKDWSEQYLKDTTGLTLQTNPWQNVGMYLTHSMKSTADSKQHEGE